MKVTTCLGCDRRVPFRESLPFVDVMGKRYRLCSNRCHRAVHRDYAGVIQATSAQPATGPRPAFAFALAISADPTTADAGLAERPTRFDASHTVRTGHPVQAERDLRPLRSRVLYCLHNLLQTQECTVSLCPMCDGLGVAARCESCAGLGYVATRSKREAQLAHVPQLEQCEVCKGHGFFPLSEELLARLGFRKDPQRASNFA